MYKRTPVLFHAPVLQTYGHMACPWGHRDCISAGRHPGHPGVLLEHETSFLITWLSETPRRLPLPSDGAAASVGISGSHGCSLQLGKGTASCFLETKPAHLIFISTLRDMRKVTGQRRKHSLIHTLKKWWYYYRICSMCFVLEIIGHTAIYFSLKFLPWYKSCNHKFYRKDKIFHILYMFPQIPRCRDCSRSSNDCLLLSPVRTIRQGTGPNFGFPTH